MARPPILYGPRGEKLKPSARTMAAWDSSSTGRRAFFWTPTSAHLNALSYEIETIRRRARDGFRRNPWAIAGSNAWVANVIGSGIPPKLRAGGDAFREHVMEVWQGFVETCHTEGCVDFYGLQELMAREAFEAGEGLVRFRPRLPEDGLEVPLQLQPLEAEHLDYTRNEDLGARGVIKAGVEFDPIGRRVAYWLYPEHPGESVVPLTRSGPSVRVPADQVLHLFHVLRAGQVRGVPGLGAVLAFLKDCLEVQDAYVLRTKIQNLFATFEVSEDGASLFDDTGQIEAQPTQDDDQVDLATLEPGEHRVLPPGKDIKFSNPPQDAGNYADFMRAALRAVAVGAGLTYEQVSGDLSGVNFSSIRAGLIEFRRRVEQYQRNVIVFQLCRPVWRRFFETAVLAGAIRIPDEERANLPRILRAAWQPPGFEYVQPEQDIRAAVRKIRSGLSSPTREAAKLGVDFEVTLEEIARDLRRARELGLELDSDPSTDGNSPARAAALTDPGEGTAGSQGSDGAGGTGAGQAGEDGSDAAAA